LPKVPDGLAVARAKPTSFPEWEPFVDIIVLSFMRYALALLCLVAAIRAQTPSPSPAGKWVSNLKFFEDNDYDRLELTLS